MADTLNGLLFDGYSVCATTTVTTGLILHPSVEISHCRPRCSKYERRNVRQRLESPGCSSIRRQHGIGTEVENERLIKMAWRSVVRVGRDQQNGVVSIIEFDIVTNRLVMEPRMSD